MHTDGSNILAGQHERGPGYWANDPRQWKYLARFAVQSHITRIRATSFEDTFRRKSFLSIFLGRRSSCGNEILAVNSSRVKNSLHPSHHASVVEWQSDMLQSSANVSSNPFILWVHSQIAFSWIMFVSALPYAWVSLRGTTPSALKVIMAVGSSRSSERDIIRGTTIGRKCDFRYLKWLWELNQW